jgi:N-acetylneuraminic acid mutarotase
LLTAREGPTATLLANGKVLVTGGDQAKSGDILASAEIYDPLTGQWTAAGAMRNARVDHSAVLLSDGKVLVAGGFGQEDLPTNVELYDPVTGSWSPTIPLITGRTGHSAFWLADGTVVLVGGFNFHDVDGSAASEIYDPTRAVARAFAVTEPRKLPTGGLQFAFNNTPGLSFTVMSATNLTEPLANWTPSGGATEILPGIYQFTDTSPEGQQRFYVVRSP